MNTLTLLAMAEHAEEVSNLAIRQAQTVSEWMHVNQLAADTNRILRSISQDASIRPELQQKADQLAYSFVEIMRESCLKIEDLKGISRKEAR